MLVKIEYLMIRNVPAKKKFAFKRLMKRRNFIHFI